MGSNSQTDFCICFLLKILKTLGPETAFAPFLNSRISKISKTQGKGLHYRHRTLSERLSQSKYTTKRKGLKPLNWPKPTQYKKLLSHIEIYTN
jgi:hypothetical protein